MRNLEINLGRACDNDCVFCCQRVDSRPDALEWMTLAAVNLELVTAREGGALSVGFIGGEPTRYPELVLALTAAREAGFERIALCTNGRRLAKHGRLDGLVAAGLTRVTLSIHSHRAEVEDAITRRPGAFEQKLGAIDHLVALRRAGSLQHGLSLNVVLHKQNVSKLAPLVRFFKRRGVDDLRFNFIRPERDAAGNPDWVPTFSQTKPALHKLIELNESDLGLHLSVADVPLCQLPWILLATPELRPRYLGELRDLKTEVTMHRAASAGGAKRFSWQDQRADELKCYLPVCQACRLQSVCEGIWRGYLDLHGETEFEQGPRQARAWVPERRRRQGRRRRRAAPSKP